MRIVITALIIVLLLAGSVSANWWMLDFSRPPASPLPASPFNGDEGEEEPLPVPSRPLPASPFR